MDSLKKFVKGFCFKGQNLDHFKIKFWGDYSLVLFIFPWDAVKITCHTDTFGSYKVEEVVTQLFLVISQEQVMVRNVMYVIQFIFVHEEARIKKKHNIAGFV